MHPDTGFNTMENAQGTECFKFVKKETIYGTKGPFSQLLTAVLALETSDSSVDSCVSINIQKNASRLDGKTGRNSRLCLFVFKDTFKSVNFVYERSE